MNRSALQYWLGYASWVLFIGALAGWFLWLRPLALGGPASFIFVRGTSMLPTYETGDLVVLMRADTYSAGDVVAYRAADRPDSQGTGRAVVIHRITSVAGGEYVLRGDNRDADDPWTPTSDEVLGRAWFSVPRVGQVLWYLVANPWVLALVLGVSGGLYVGFGWKDEASAPGEARGLPAPVAPAS